LDRIRLRATTIATGIAVAVMATVAVVVDMATVVAVVKKVDDSNCRAKGNNKGKNGDALMSGRGVEASELYSIQFERTFFSHSKFVWSIREREVEFYSAPGVPNRAPT
jgi:hypothetical protein